MLGKLEFLIALSREQNFSRAAEACGVTQPTFSAGIKQLEESLGMPLVLRSSRFRGFTPEGERVLDWARRIVSDMRGMRDELGAMKRGLVGHLRIAAIPTALAVVAELTTPYRARHPNVRFSIYSCTSIEILAMLENLEIDAGLTYLDNEPVGRARTVPLYVEHYRLMISRESPLADRAQVTWAEVAKIPLCLLTPDNQNRRIIEQRLRSAGTPLEPSLESNSIVVLVSHVQTGRWACVMPERLVNIFRLAERLRAIPIVEPEAAQAVGLVVPHRDPLSPLTEALVSEARLMAEPV